MSVIYQVPSYSPGSIAEYAIAQIMALAKNTHMSYVMTKKANFEVTSMQVSEERDDDRRIQGAKLMIIQFKMQCLLLENKICGVLGTGFEQ